MMLNIFLRHFSWSRRYSSIFVVSVVFFLYPLTHATEGNPPKDSEAWRIINEYFGEENYLSELGCWRAFYQLTDKDNKTIIYKYTPQFAEKVFRMGESDPITMPKCMGIQAWDAVNTGDENRIYFWLQEYQGANEKFREFAGFSTISQPLLYVKKADAWQFEATTAFVCRDLPSSSICPSGNLRLEKISSSDRYAWVYESSVLHQTFTFANYHIFTNFDEIFKDIGCNNTIQIDPEERPYSEYRMEFVKNGDRIIYPIKFTHYLSLNPIVQYIEDGFNIADPAKGFNPVYKGNSIVFFFDEEIDCYDINRNYLYFL